MLLVALSMLVCPRSPIIAEQHQPVSAAEKEDLGFINNLFKDKIYEFARQEAESFLDKYPDSRLIPDVILIQAKMNVAEGKFDLALRQYQKIISHFPESELVEHAMYLSGTLKLRLKQPDGMVDLNRLITKFPKTTYLADVSFIKGQQAYQAEQWQVAEYQFKQVLESEGITDQQRIETQHNLSWIYYHTGNTLMAKSLFFDALDSPITKEEKARIAYQLGIEAQKSGRHKNALSWFARQLSEWPDPDIKPKSDLGIAQSHYYIFKENPKQSSKKDREKSVKLLTTNIKSKNPISLEQSRYQRGWLLNSLNRKKAAESDFAWLQKNSKKHAADLEISATRAQYYENKKWYKSANKIYATALKYQEKQEIRNMLLLSIVRNSHVVKDCNSVIKWQKQVKLPAQHKDRLELSYYLGNCYFAKKNWKKAGLEYAKLPLNNQFARAAFGNYLQVFKKTKNFNAGYAYLDKVSKISSFGSGQNNLLYKIDLCLTLERWAKGVELMLLLKKQDQKKARDPWYLLNIAKTADQVFYAYSNKKHPMRQHPLKARKYYANLALGHYTTAYRYLPRKEKETKLSVLDILIARYKAIGSHQKVVGFYRDAIKLVDNQQQKLELQIVVADIMASKLNQRKKAQKELYAIHNTGDTEAHFKASSLLAELYVGQQRYIQAIKILEDLAKQPIQKTQWYSTTHYRLGELYQSNERWQKAMEHYNSVVKDNQNSTLAQKAKVKADKIQKYLDQNS